MKHLSTSLSLLIAVSIPSLALAQSPQTVAPHTTVAPSNLMGFSYDRFVPNPSKDIRMDYSVWDDMLKEMVYYTGPSLRQRAPKPVPIVGTRRVYGHTSPYRLEGNKVVFESMGREFKDVLNEYVSDLEAVANDITISGLPRNEQLAFWLNLHNALVIQGIAENYPIQSPSKNISQNGQSFHDIPRVTIDGVSLSLKNIREDIVYRNWSDPLVIYGFFHGDIGSPSIQRKAYTGSNVRETLEFSANEFANSLRGIMVYGKTASVSRHYGDAAPYFFPNFNNDLRQHLVALANDNVGQQLVKAKNPFKIASYEDEVADLTRGEADRGPLSQVENSNEFGTFGPPNVLARALNEQTEKFRRIRKRGLFSSVTIEDIQTVDDADFGKPTGPRSIEIGPIGDISSQSNDDDDILEP